jgi:hypothetical protein
VTGALGKRNKEKFSMKTPAATIGIRGTTFVAEWIEPEAENLAMLAAWRSASVAGLGDAGLAEARPVLLAQNGAPSGGTGRAPGLYVNVIDGLISLSNRGGKQVFSAGQFGYTASVIQPPVVVPTNPGIRFTPPPTFRQNSSGPNTESSTKANAVDCEVR